jgi:dTDP-4-dehydrorhamnose reductase
MPMTDRILVTGAAGRLGSAVVKAFEGCEVVAHTHGTLDVTDPVAVQRAVSAVAPALVINCVGFNDVDGSEERATEALAVNAFAVRSLARAAEECGATFVHFGTDFVFDGSASEPYGEEVVPAPRSIYGLSKLLGEWFALEVPRGFVLRVESLFGSVEGWTGRQGSLDAIIDGLERGRDVRVFTDRVVSPSYAHDVARAVKHVATSGAAPGIYHCVNSGHATWHDVAVEAARLLGVRPRLTPVTLEEVAFRAPRPRFCALSNRKLAAAGWAMPDWTDALQRWLAARNRRHVKIDEVHG